MTVNFSYVNHVDASDVILSSFDQAGDLTPSNVASTIIGRRFRSTTLTTWIQADFGANKSVDVVCLRFPRDTPIPLSGTVQHQFDADGGTAGTGAVHDSTAIAIGTADGYGYHVYKPGSTLSTRYWRATFNVSGVSFIDIGRMWAGAVLVPEYDIAFGDFADEWRDASVSRPAERSGAEYVDERYQQRAWAFGLNAIDDTDFDSFRELSRVAGVRKQVLVVRDPSSPAKETIIGRLARTNPLRHRDLNLYSKAFELVESP